MIVVRQDEIEDYKRKISFSEEWRERDFVERIRDYVDSDYHSVLLVNGLRGTGKTVGILQAITGRDAIYVTMERFEDSTTEKMIEFLRSLTERIIVLDEYTWISKGTRNEAAGFLASLVCHGKRVILSGSESLNLATLKDGELIHRTFTIDTSYMSFPEYCRINGITTLDQKSCDKYLTTGSLFGFYNRDGNSKRYGSIEDYIEDVILYNLNSYVRDHASRATTAGIGNCIYTLFYQAIWDLLRDDPKILESVESIEAQENFRRLGIDQSLRKVNLGELNEVAYLLEWAGVLIEVKNLIGKGSRTYVTNPALTYQLVRLLFPEYNNFSSLLGKIYEASCMVDLYHKKSPNDGIYYLLSEEDESCEIDIVVAENDDRPSKLRLYLIECKHAYRYNIWNKRISLCMQNIEDVIFDKFPCCEIVGRFILHPGEESWQVHNSGKGVAVVNQTKHLYKYYLCDKLQNELPRLTETNTESGATEKLNVF